MPGTGSVFKITDRAGRTRWVAQLSIGPRTGRRQIKRTCDTEREARAALRELTAEHDRGVNPSRLLLSAFLAEWVANARNIRPGTRRGYEDIIRIHIDPTIGDIRLQALSPMHVEMMLTTLAPTMAPKSLRNIHAVLRRALGQAARMGLVARNVASADYVDAPRVPRAEPRVLSHDETRRLLDVVRGDPWEALIVTALGTGLRMGELLGLAWEDVELGGNDGQTATVSARDSRKDHVGQATRDDDASSRPVLASRRDAGFIHVRHGLRRVPGPTRRDGHYVRDELKTARSRRTVPLSPSVVAALQAHRERLIAANLVPVATGPVFPNIKGGPLSPSWVTHRFYALLEAAKIHGASFKVLRATFATRLFEAGVPDRRVADLLGHQPGSRVTHGHYIASGSEWDAALEAVEELVG